MSLLDTIKSAISDMPVGGLLGTQGSVIGIDIGTASIKMVQLRRDHGRAVLETYGAITLGPYANTDMGKVTNLEASVIASAITDLIKEANITTNNAAAAIPFSSSLTSVIEMPGMPEDQLNKMVPIEARKYIPTSTSEVTMDWFVIPQDDTRSRGDTIKGVYDSPSADTNNINKKEVLLVAIHNSTLTKYQSIMTTANLEISFYELEVFSAARASLGHGIAPIVLVDFGASSTKVYVVEQGIVRMSHLINKGGQNLTDYIARTLNVPFKKAERLKQEHGIAEGDTVTLYDGSQVHLKDSMLSTLDHIYSEINRVLLSYGKRYNKNITEVLFCGGGASMKGFTDYAKTKIEADVKLADPFSKIQTPAFLDDVLKEVGPEFTVATGIALRQLYSGN